MDFFNGFGRKVNKVVRSMTEKSVESAGLARVTNELKEATAQRDKLFMELGKVCYALQCGEGDTDRASALVMELDVVLARIRELSDQRDALAAPRRCPGCGSVQGREARYCSNCGKRLLEEAPVAAPDADAEYCPNCGALRQGEGAVCGICGRPFDPQTQAPEPEDAPPADIPINTEEPEDGGEE